MNLSELFSYLDPPDPALFNTRDDPNDPRMGDMTPSDHHAYESANVVLLGCPQDEGVRRNRGRPGASDAPDAIRDCFYALSNNSLEDLPIFDAGNTQIQSSLEETHDLHQTIVSHILEDDKTLVILGGGNDISYPDCAALSESENGDIIAFNFDAHLDVRADSTRSSGTPYRQLLEEGYLQPENFCEIGWQLFSNSPIYIDFLHQQGIVHHPMKQVREQGIDGIIDSFLSEHPQTPIFWGLDMDVVRASDAPGVSAPNPVGLTSEDVLDIATIAGTVSYSRIFEITEVNPTYDVDTRTCRLAALAIWHFLAAVAQRKDTP